MAFVEIFEFDAMDDPPSVLDVEVYDFDGPYDEATSLGHAEINFLKTNIQDLADFWVPLQGKLALACQSKLHLRIFLDHTRGGNVIKDYLTKMEKEVGKKVTISHSISEIAFAYELFFLITFYTQFHIFLFIAAIKIILDKCAVSSNKFSLPETFWASTRGISH